jgi:hypothetical protein
MSGNLLDSLDWANKVRCDRDNDFVKTPKKAADLITAAKVDGPPSFELAVKPGEGTKQTRAKQKARAFVDLVKNGLSPEDAAERIGMDLGEVTRISSAADMKELVARTLETGHIRSDIRKEVLRAGLNQSIMEALAEGDRKGFYDGYKLAASDPEIGLTGPSTVLGVQVNIGDDGIGGILKEFMGGAEPPPNSAPFDLDISGANGVISETSAGDHLTETEVSGPPSEDK